MLLRVSSASWSARAVSDELTLPHARTRAYLEALVARGLAQVAVHGEMTYGFRPVSEALAGYCEELAIYMEQSRADVLRFVAALPPPSVRSFAQAFRLRDPE